MLFISFNVSFRLRKRRNRTDFARSVYVRALIRRTRCTVYPATKGKTLHIVLGILELRYVGPFKMLVRSIYYL